MKFNDALLLMLDGKKVQRKKWLMEDYVYLDGQFFYSDSGDSWTMALSDYRADDWQEYVPFTIPNHIYTFVKTMAKDNGFKTFSVFERYGSFTLIFDDDIFNINDVFLSEQIRKELHRLNEGYQYYINQIKGEKL